MDQYHESQTAGKCIATSSPAKHDMSQARLYRINDYDQGSKLTLVRWPVASGFAVGPVKSVIALGVCT